MSKDNSDINIKIIFCDFNKETVLLNAYDSNTMFKWEISNNEIRKNKLNDDNSILNYIQQNYIFTDFPFNFENGKKLCLTNKNTILYKSFSNAYDNDIELRYYLYCNNFNLYDFDLKLPTINIDDESDEDEDEDDDFYSFDYFNIFPIKNIITSARSLHLENPYFKEVMYMLYNDFRNHRFDKYKTNLSNMNNTSVITEQNNNCNFDINNFMQMQMLMKMMKSKDFNNLFDDVE